MHRPPQKSSSEEQRHCPVSHDLPPEQTDPHWPQFAWSLDRSTQEVPHSDRPGSHDAAHRAEEQTSPVAQACPHEPQFLESLDRATQMPAHDICPAPHRHCPPVHVAPPEHALSHPPQCESSEPRSTQARLQSVRPALHDEEQLPELQTSLEPQREPQSPQFRGSDAVRTHSVAHLRSFAWHAGAPPEPGTAPVPGAPPDPAPPDPEAPAEPSGPIGNTSAKSLRDPQAWVTTLPTNAQNSVRASFLNTSIFLSGGSTASRVDDGDDYRHWLFEHLPASQTLPQPPQLARSVFVFTQVPPTPLSLAPQSAKPPGQAQLAALQIIPASHFLPQLPQFAALDWVFTQTGGVPHSWLPAAHWQTPA